ncbi:MAG: beta-galactosidase [Solirubrobacteraceae bacterium]|nr:beta-galactosidase [Solirubrobacteraceae bacterium]
MTSAVAALALGLAACGGGVEQKAAAADLPQDFFGVVAPELLPAEQSELRQALDAQSKAGVDLIRQPFRWNEIEPKKGAYNFELYDRLVGRAADAGITILPIVFGVPKREASKKKKGVRVTATTTMPPKSNARFAKYAAKLVQRYGTTGTFWAENPTVTKRPITEWQIWNEPNLPPYWGGKPDAKAYAKLLTVTAAAVRKADPSARVLTGGMPESKIGVPLKTFVRQLAKAAGPGSYDVLAVHPYAKTAAGVIAGAEAAQKAATINGKKPAIWITECGWATGRLGSDFTVSEKKQAELIAELVRLSAAKADALNLQGVVYYAWRDVPPYPGGKDFWGLHTGMVRKNNTVKPSLTAYASAVKTARGAES